VETAAAAADPAVLTRKRAEMSTELLHARRWILGVGIAIFVYDMFSTWDDPLPDWIRYQVSFFDGIVLLVFVALWWFARKAPRLCCILALCAYWGLQAWIAWISGDPANLFKGAILKILFTMALVRGAANAYNAAKLRTELGDVFA
jgi:hypothetical protein